MVCCGGVSEPKWPAGGDCSLFARGKVQCRSLEVGVQSIHYHVGIAMSSSGLRRQETVVLEDCSRSPSYFFNFVLVNSLV